MGWVVDEYVKLKTQNSRQKLTHLGGQAKLPPKADAFRRAGKTQNLRAVVTGKAIKDGGSEGRTEANGLRRSYSFTSNTCRTKIRNPRF